MKKGLFYFLKFKNQHFNHLRGRYVQFELIKLTHGCSLIYICCIIKPFLAKHMYYEVIYLLAFSFNILSNMCMYMHSVQSSGAGQDNQVYTDKTPNMYM